jgi:malate synthase
MAAFIPSRRDPQVNERALARVTEDKRREAADGFDGSWVAHPDLVPVVDAVFDAVLGDQPNQKHRRIEAVHVTRERLLDVNVPGGTVTIAGVRTNIRVGLEYLDNWLEGRGAVGIDNLMEDAATAEISRMQLTQWVRHEVPLDDGAPLTLARYRTMLDEEANALRAHGGLARLEEAVTLLDQVVREVPPVEFVTLPAYELLG